jgi:hypothetical protein
MLAAIDILDGQPLMTWCHSKELTLTQVCKWLDGLRNPCTCMGNTQGKKGKKKVMGGNYRED